MLFITTRGGGGELCSNPSFPQEGIPFGSFHIIGGIAPLYRLICPVRACVCLSVCAHLFWRNHPPTTLIFNKDPCGAEEEGGRRRRRRGGGGGGGGGREEEEEEEATAEHHPATTTSDEQRGGGKNETRFEGLCRILRASRVECHLQRIEVLCNPLAALHHCSKRSPFK